jgi:LCP family protein required for cell wall assembly
MRIRHLSHRGIRVVIWTVVIGVFVFGTLGFFKASYVTEKFLAPQQAVSLAGFTQAVSHLRSNVQAENDITNLLLIGKDLSGELTDVLMLVQYHHARQEFRITSIPRDTLIFRHDKYLKLNNLERQVLTEDPANFDSDEADNQLSEFISTQLNLHIHYYLSVNFFSFATIVDMLGGIQIQNDNRFTDCYPNNAIKDPNNIYYNRCTTFESGLISLNGYRALMYIRSRLSDNRLELGDLARSKREQNVILAIMTQWKNTPKTDFLSLDKMKLGTDEIEKNVRFSGGLPQVVEILNWLLELKKVGTPTFARRTLDTSLPFFCEVDTQYYALDTRLFTLCDQSVLGREDSSGDKSLLQKYFNEF